MRGISIRPPWADAVVDGHKGVENRRRGFPRNYRGLLLVQAALTWSPRGGADPRVLNVYPDLRRMPARPARGELVPPFTLGAVLGTVELVDAHRDAGCCRPWGESSYVEDGGTVRGDLVHLVLEAAHRFAEPIPARGFVGLWVPDEDLRLEVEARTA